VQALGGWKSLAVVRNHYTGDIQEAHRAAMDSLDAPQAPPSSDQQSTAS
jgi:hypothetical protein